MQNLTLYLMLGYPGAGKTTVAKMIAEQTGAVHIWADHERRAIFAKPTHSREESNELYAELNKKTDKLLAEGKSVIFDTNFNFYKDRQHLRQIAAEHGAKTVLIWLTTPQDIAEQRAVHDSHDKHTRIWGNMTHEDFHRIAGHLELPHSDENVFAIDGQHIETQDIRDLLVRITAA